jgi:hypothetical protein
LPDVDLLTFDPIAASQDGDIEGGAVYGAGVQVQNTLMQMVSYLSGATQGTWGVNEAYGDDLIVLTSETLEANLIKQLTPVGELAARPCDRNCRQKV